MKHVFLINPAAGSVNAESKLRPIIAAASAETGIPTEIYLSKTKGDLAQYVRVLSAAGAPVRFYACGGDGTLHETINGSIGYPHVEVASIPTGTGNDFIRNFTNPDLYKNIRAQLCGQAHLFDLIRLNDRYAVNMINIGFDCSVVEEAARLKNSPFLPGIAAYLAGVVSVLVQKYGIALRITYESGKVVDKEILLLAIANGSFCGGGFRNGFAASLSDGFLDVCLAHKLSRLQFIRLVSSYRKGTYMQTKLGRQYVVYEKVKKLFVTAKSPIHLCADGEISEVRQVSLSVVPQAVRFSLPQGSSVIQNEPLPNFS